jgi:hypothetical protein
MEERSAYLNPIQCPLYLIWSYPMTGFGKPTPPTFLTFSCPRLVTLERHASWASRLKKKSMANVLRSASSQLRFPSIDGPHLKFSEVVRCVTIGAG